MKKTTFLAFLLSAFGLLSVTAQNTDFYDGIFVLNEGGFMAGNASLSFFNPDGDLQNNVYTTVNNTALGDTAQHMAFNNDYAYVILNGSNEVVIAEAGTMEQVARVTDSVNLINPRYIAFNGTNAYITCWGDAGVATDDYVAIMNLATNTITGTIPVGEGPEKIVSVNGVLFVALKGGYSNNNKLLVISAATGEISQNLTIGQRPGSLEVKDNMLYVLCEGITPFPSEDPEQNVDGVTGSLYKYTIDGNSIALSSSVVFPNLQNPSQLQVNGDYMYYTKGAGIYRIDPTNPLLPTEPLFSLPEEQGVYGIYGFNIIDDTFYIGDAVDFVANGKVYTYTLEGELLDEYIVGKLPNGFYKAPSEPLAVNSNTLADITVYPNPATSVIYISTVKPAAVKLYDVTGRVVKAENYTMAGINLTGLSKGNYFMEITSENAKTVKQIVIK